MIYAYVRVSTEKQSLEVQHYEITKYCESRGMEINMYVEEKVSGTVDFKLRGLNKIMKRCKPGDVVVITEISRIGRSMIGIFEAVEYFIKKKVTLISLKEGFVLDNDKPVSKLIVSVFAFLAESERTMICERTREGLEKRKRDGIKLGRPVGAKSSHYKTDERKDDIIKWLKKEVPKTKIAKRCKVNVSSIYAFMKREGISL